MKVQVMDYTGDQLTPVGGPMDLSTSQDFNSIAYDSQTKTLWLGLGTAHRHYNMTDPTNPTWSRTINFGGFSPFQGGVAIDVQGRAVWYASQSPRDTGKVKMYRADLDTFGASLVSTTAVNTTSYDYMSMAIDTGSKTVYAVGGSYSNQFTGNGSAFRVTQPGQKSTWLLPSYNFRGVAVDARRGAVFFTTNDPAHPVYVGITSMTLNSSTVIPLVTANDSSNQPGTAYTGVFATSTDLAFFLHDATDGSTGVDVVSVSTGGCSSSGSPCLNADNTCGCTASNIFSSVTPVAKCKHDNEQRYTVHAQHLPRLFSPCLVPTPGLSAPT